MRWRPVPSRRPVTGMLQRRRVALDGHELLRKDQRRFSSRSVWSFSTEVREEPAKSARVWVKARTADGDGDGDGDVAVGVSC